jgi:hypothetical protein
MDDNDLFLAMLGVFLAAVMLVAGGLFLIANYEPAGPLQQPVPVGISWLQSTIR